MTTSLSYSHKNVSNSVATFLADVLVAEGYLVYWHEIDTLQASTAWYPSYYANATLYAADATLQGLIAAAPAIVTLRGEIPTNPTYLTRLPHDGLLGDPAALVLPVLAVGCGDAVPVVNYELGTPLKWRVRRLSVQGALRTQDEQKRLADLLSVWLDNDTMVTVEQHDGSATRAPVGEVRLTRVSVTTSTLPTSDAQASTFGLSLLARLEYVA